MYCDRCCNQETNARSNINDSTCWRRGSWSHNYVAHAFFSLHTVHPLKNCKMLRNSFYPSQPVFSFKQPLNSVSVKLMTNSTKRTTINSQNDTKNNRKEANDVGRTELARDEQTDSDSRPIGFRGIASREEGTKRQREKKGGWVGGRHPGSRAFDRGWRVVAWRKSDLSGNLSRDTKFKSQSAFRASRTRDRKRERERERVKRGRCVSSRRGGLEKWIRNNRRGWIRNSTE